MDAQVRAGIDLYGTALRYAEVERYGTKHRLLRLGSCDFDFDVTRALWNSGASENGSGANGTSEQVETLAEALADVYERTSAQKLRVVVHPPQAHSFFAPVPAQTAEADRLARFRREARLLAHAGTDPGESAPDDDALHVTADGLYAENDGDGRREWFHVLAVDGGANARFRRVMEHLPLPGFQWKVSMEGAAHAATVLEHRRRERSDAEQGSAPGGRATPDAPFTLAVGHYPGHLELALCRHGRFHFALHAPRAEPADSAYFAAALLERFEVAPSSVGCVFAYGFGTDAPDDFAVLERLTGAAPEPLDFRPIVDLEPGRLADDFEAGTYVPCIGAAL